MSFYEKIIQEATGVDTKTAKAIEEIIRCQHPTLDHLSKRQLFALAQAGQTALMSDAELQELYLGEQNG